ncbi:MAG TPA: hypothetical protein VG796_17545 [Verrucomicrobiales bacterium]|nr:hypothetical protein [Verrucomicrobiales bacterium]
MLLIFGTRVARHTLGSVAEECPACLQPGVCRLEELSLGSHFFFLPMGRGSVPLGHEACCPNCSRRFPVDAVLYHGIGRKRNASLAELIPLTSPWLGLMDARQCSQETRFRNILSPFVRFDTSFRDRSVRIGPQLDRVGVVAVLLMIFGPTAMAGLVMSDRVPFLTNPQTVAAAWICSALLIIWGFYMILSESGRFYRRQLLPRILDELAPLAPQRSEWEAVMLRMKRLRFPSWRLVKHELSRRYPHRDEPQCPMGSPLPAPNG